MMIYRYFNEQHGLAALQQRRWKVGRLLELNDPLDCQPTLINVSPEISSGNQPAFEKQFFSNINDSIGIVCYSATVSDPVVWSHYADGHRGLALGFEFPSDVNVYQVHYPDNNARAKLDYIEIQRLIDEDKQKAWFKVISEGFTIKAKSWAYEQEYRLFSNLTQQCVMVGRHYFKPIPITHLKQIVLGVKCTVSKSDVERITQKWSLCRTTEIFKAETSRTSYDIHI
jgi:hypothetical protein